MLTVVSWLWSQDPGLRARYECEHVNVLYRSVSRALHVPHRFVCVTDAKGLDQGIERIPLWPGPKARVLPGRPNCYRRLRAFAADAGDIFGPRLLSIDLDAVIVGDITPLVERPEDFVIWGDTAKGTPYNGSLWLLRTGTRSRVWDEFDPRTSPAIARQRRYIGSDQAWIGACLGEREAKWTRADGVYSFRNEVNRSGLPDNARIVFFHGASKPWDPQVQSRHRWIGEHWR